MWAESQMHKGERSRAQNPDETEALAQRWHQESWGWSCTVWSGGQGPQTHRRPIPPSYNFKCKFVSLKERRKEQMNERRKSGQWWCSPLIQAFGRQIQVNL